MNRAACILTGYRREELLEKTLINIVLPAEYEKSKIMVSQLIRQQQLLFEITLQSKNGDAIPVEVHSRLFRLDGRETVISTLRDLRERKQMLEEKAKQEQLLIQQSKMAAMGEMIGAISHQWKQPLNALSLMAANIEDSWEFGELDERTIKRFHEDSQHQIQFMTQTIDDFRNFFRPDRHESAFSIKEAMGQVLRIVQPQIDKHRITLDLFIPDDLKAFGYANEFKQVAMNLLSNSKDAILEHHAKNPDAGRIVISALTDESWIAISFCDDGGGIDEAFLPTIFDPFVTSKGEQGTGIGLQLARTIVEERLRGFIEARNEGEGACFIIRLPRYAS